MQANGLITYQVVQGPGTVAKDKTAELDRCVSKASLDVEYLKTVLLMQSAYKHSLCRDRAQQVAKDEIAEMGRRVSRGSLDVEYLKTVLLNGFEAGELPTTSGLFPVLSRLLSFGPEEQARALGSAGAKPNMGRSPRGGTVARTGVKR